jgi:hypothetical protein
LADVLRSHQVTLEVHRDVAGETDPLLLASFPESVIIDGMQLEYRSGASWKAQLCGETEKLEIVGTNYGRSHHNLDAAQWMVGIFDPSSDVMAVHPVAHAFPLRSSIKGYRVADLSVSDASSARERRALLFEDFGASKKKRALAASAANQVSSEQAVGAEALGEWFQTASTASDDEGKADPTDAAIAEGRKHLLPPFDLHARDPALCYDVRSILGQSERGALGRQHAGLVAAARGETGRAWLAAEPASAWPQFVLTRLQAAEGDREAVIDLLLLRHLLALHLKQPKHFQSGLKEEAQALGMPAEVLGYVPAPKEEGA